ncbi:MAG: ABC transporter permease [Chitinophagales bacterium]|nr:ABC transporter permease [Chitinophagales bacterium]
MIRNYLKTAFRNLLRNRSFTIINIAGLALSVACALIIFINVQFEKSFDHFNSQKSRIYRIVTNTSYSDGTKAQTSGVPLLLGEALQVDMPQLKDVTTAYSQFNSFFAVTDPETGEVRKFKQDDGIYYIQPDFFKIFTFPWITGNPATAMAEPNSIALSKSVAEQFFGDWKKAIGQSIKVNHSFTLQVNGIMNDSPDNSSIPLKIAMSFITFRTNDSASYNQLSDWGNISSNFNAYVLLPPNMSAASIDRLLPSFSKKHYRSNTNEQMLNSLQPLSDVHFNQDYGSDVRTVSKTTLNGVILIALFVVLMACINFINLATALATRRSREVGVRKVLGSSRFDLVKQFAGETFLIVTASSVIGIAIAVAAFPFVKDLTNLPDNVSILFSSNVWIWIAIIILAVTVLAGTYPALVLSGFQPIQALKNKIPNRTKTGVSLRAGLVVFQFLISQVLIIATIITAGLLQYIHQADLGLNPNVIMQVPLYSDTTAIARFSDFKNEVQQLSSVTNVSISSDAPTSENDWSTNFSFDHRPKDEDFNVYLKFADADFFRTYGLKFLAGQGYEQSDTSKEVVINKTLMKKLGVSNPQDAIGKMIRTGRGKWKPVVGVVKDFKTNSLHETVKPTYISCKKDYYGIAGIKILPGTISETITAVNKIWDRIYPEYFFGNTFLDENIAQFYLQDEKLAKLYKVVAALAIFISCLGLFGLVSFFIANRTKEVGIRKVLGASIANISALFLKYFLVLVIVALIIAIPMGWYLMNSWLQNFVFRINISWWTFILAGLLSISIAVLTVIVQILRLAFINPVKSLRIE